MKIALVFVVGACLLAMVYAFPQTESTGGDGEVYNLPMQLGGIPISPYEEVPEELSSSASDKGLKKKYIQYNPYYGHGHRRPYYGGWNYGYQRPYYGSNWNIGFGGGFGGGWGYNNGWGNGWGYHG